MKRNLARWDRIGRIFVGVVLLSLVFVGPQSLWGLLGLVPLLTGLAGFCPLYRCVGASTCSIEPPRHPPHQIGS